MASAGRPAVSVVVPFLGSAEDARALAATLERLDTRSGDELIVADNTVSGTFGGAVSSDRIAVVRSTGEHSSYRSRNVGAASASNDWLLFFDADCRPRADLIDRYFDGPIEADAGAVAGAVLPRTERESTMSRYERSRELEKQAPHLENPYKPFAVTANLLVRRAAWEGVGGFQEGIRSAGDADFCWRIQDAGWTLGYREDAVVEHKLREGLRAYLRLHARYGGGLRWLGNRHQGARIGAKPQRAVRMLAGVVRWTLAGQLQRGLFRAIDAAVVAAESAGSVAGNSPPRWRHDPVRGGIRVAVMVDRFPEPSETFVVNEARALGDLGAAVSVEARVRPARPAIGAGWGLDVHWVEDSGILRKAIDLAWLAARHPGGVLADVRDRRRWRREEEPLPLRALAPLARRITREGVEHLHVHFARRSALDALRMSRLLGIPYSVTAHAWDIFREPINLAEKIERAAFVTTGCEYNVRHLRRLASPASADRIHEIVMGIDPERFSRTASYGGDGTVLAIGRLVEKKGFAHLLDAAAILRDFDGLAEVVIVGDGELRGELEERGRSLGVNGLVRFAGAKRPEEVRALLEGAALLAMPAVVAADGDRDSMPVVVKEALAMGVPVVASDEVGLPEVVRDEWGRLVPPGDPETLAGAIRELLELPRSERARMGESGRDFVLGEYSLAHQTRRLLDLIEEVRARAPGASPRP